MAIDFSKYLPVGEACAVPAEQLVRTLRLGDKRTLRKAVAAARAEGQVICTVGGPDGGYFLPKNRAEILAWTATMSRKAASTFAALKSARAALEQMDGQMQLIEEERPAPNDADLPSK